MNPLEPLIQSVLAPALGASLVFLAIVVVFHRAFPNKRWGSGLAFVAGYLFCQFALLGLPQGQVETLAYGGGILIASLFLFIPDDFRDWPLLARSGFKLFLLGLGCWALIPTRMWAPGEFSGGEWFGPVAFGTLLLLPLWLSYDLLGLAVTPPKIWAGLSAIFTGVALTLVFSGTAKAGQLAGGAAATCGALAATSLWKPSLGFGRAASAAVVLALGWLVGNGFLFADMPWFIGILALASGFSLWFTRAKFLLALPKWASAAVSFGLCLIPSGAVALWAFSFYEV